MWETQRTEGIVRRGWPERCCVSEDEAEEDHQLDVEYQWLMADKAAPLKAVHYLWEYKYAGRTTNVVNVRSSIHDLLVLKRFAEDKLYELGELSDKEVDTYNKQIP